MFKRLSSIFILLLNVMISIALNTGYAQVNNLALTSLSVKDGLSQGTVNSMLQDSTGFIWLAHQNGINIYDGYRFRKLNGPEHAFDDMPVFKLAEDKDGLIWINLNEHSVYSYNPKTDEYQKVPTQIPENSDYYITDVIVGENDNIWISTSKSLNVYNKVSKEFRQVLDLKSHLSGPDRVNQITLHNNIIYMGSKNGTFAYDIASNRCKKLPVIAQAINDNTRANIENSHIIYTVTGIKNTLYLGSADGFFALDITDIRQYINQDTSLPNHRLIIANTSLWNVLIEDDYMYLASDKGLIKLNTENNTHEFLFGFGDYYDDVTNNNIISLFKDLQGNFWLASKVNGIYIWNPNRGLVDNYRYKLNSKRSLSHNAVWDIVASKFHEHWLWVATSNGLNLIDRKSDETRAFIVNSDSKDMFTESHILDIIELNANQLLLYTAQGIRVFDVEQQQLIPLPFSDNINEMLRIEQRDILKENDTTVWLSNEEGIQKIDLLTGDIHKIAEINQLFTKNQWLRLLGFRADSTRLLFTSNNVLWQLNTKNDEITKLYEHPGILKDEWVDFDSWTIDGENVLWIAYPTKGLIGFSLDNPEEKYFYHQANSIIDNNVYGVMTDSEGDVWFSTHNGIFLLSAKTHHLRHFTTKNGLVATEYNGRSFEKIANNFIYGSMEGVSIFDPLALKKVTDEEHFQVKITAVNVLSRQISSPLVIENNAEVELKYDDVGIQIDYSTFLRNSNNAIEYNVSLSGTNNINYPLTSENSITFPSLSSGLYTLKISAKSPETGEFTPPAILRLNVSYAPWLSPLAYLIYTIICLTVGFVIYRYRRKQQQMFEDIHEQVKYREKRLQLALTGSNSEVWDWQASDNMMFGKRIFIDLGYKYHALFYDFSEHIALIHPEDKALFISRWQRFIEQADLNESFDCTYRLKSEEGKWLWYKDLGKIVALNTNGKPSRVTGSYTNVTQSRVEEERALYYGDAFKRTKDWVLIFDEKLSRVTANQSIREVFNWPEEEFDFDINILGIKTHRVPFYRDLLLSLKEGSHWRGEEFVTTQKGEQYYVIVNVTVGKNSVTNALHYIFVLTDITAQKTAEKELRYLANYDHLTGLPNRSMLLDRIAHAIDFAKRKNVSIALFFIDLDRFKQVNDSLGHDYGDLLLKAITTRLKNTLRSDDTVARLGGDEFVVLLESFSGNNQLARIAQKLIDVLGNPVTLNNKEVNIGASIGIAVYPNDSNTSEELIKNADVAMYHAKKSGRNNFQFFTDEMNLDAKSRLDKESKLKAAVKKDDFINYYQAIVDSTTGKAVGFEMLLRWQCDDKILHPDEFIPLSEELGLITSLTEAAIERGLKVLKEWHSVRPDVYLSVNLAAQHFSTDDLVPYIEGLLTQYDLSAQALRIEITESALISEPEKAISTMCALSAMGIHLALDDFGTGFSSLAYLKQLPLNYIKIDKTFVSGIGIYKADEAIIDTTLVLSKRLGLGCIAEGVETEEQLYYLVNKGCHYIQGFYYGEPEPAQTIMHKLTLNVTETMVR